jgi:hypothetical protein
VAIVQVSRITQRTGLEQDLPQPLAGAEFGWAIDQRKLYIGNGTIADGAPIVGNTEVLTEFSDILIRTLDLYAGLVEHGYTTVSLDYAFENKTGFNKTRPEKHGVRF